MKTTLIGFSYYLELQHYSYCDFFMSENKNESWNNALMLLALGITLAVIFHLFHFLRPIQPFIPIAVLAGMLYGHSKGFSVGFFGFLAFSLLFGFAGLFSWIEAFACGIAGLLGAAAARNRTPSKTEFITLSAIAAIGFEIFLNLAFNAYYFTPALNAVYYFDVPALASAVNILAAIILALLLSDLLKSKK